MWDQKFVFLAEVFIISITNSISLDADFHITTIFECWFICEEKFQPEKKQFHLLDVTWNTYFRSHFEFLFTISKSCDHIHVAKRSIYIKKLIIQCLIVKRLLNNFFETYCTLVHFCNHWDPISIPSKWTYGAELLLICNFISH